MHYKVLSRHSSSRPLQLLAFIDQIVFKLNAMTHLIAREHVLFLPRLRFPDDPVEGSGIVQKIEGVVTVALSEFRDAISRAFHCFYQKRAEIHHIKRDHTAWRHQLKEEHKRVVEAWKDSSRFYIYIPAISDTMQKAKALKGMLFLETIMPLLTKQSENLQKLLKDKELQDALQCIKVTVQEVDKLAIWDNVLLDFLLKADSAEVKLEKLDAIEKSVEEKKSDPRYALLVRFIDYARRSLKGMPYTQGYEGASDVPLETAELITEEYFRTGALLAVSYRHISDVVEEVTKVERAVKAASCRLYDDIGMACGGREPKCEALLENATLVLNHANNLLQAKAFSTHVHAGMYYEDAVRTHLCEVGRGFEQFKQELAGEFGHTVRAMNRLVAYLTIPSDRIDERIFALYEVCVLGRLLSRPNDLNCVLEQTIAKEGNRLLAFTGHEKHFSKQIFERSLSWRESEDAFITYLMKGLLLNVFFKDESFQDTEFERTFFMLKTDAAYKRGFEEALKRHPTLRALHDIYLSSYERQADSLLLSRITKALVMWHSPVPKETLQEAFARDAQVRVFKLEELISSLAERTKIERARKRTLQDMVLSYKMIRGKDMECKEEQQTYLSALLHPSLLKELFNCYLPHITKDDVRGLVKDEQFSLKEVHGLTRLLLMRWKLDDLMKAGVKRGKNEEEILLTVFTEFLGSDEARSLWRCQYDFGTLEIMLDTFYTIKGDKKLFVKARGEGFEMWQQLVTLYKAFREIISRDNGLLRQTKEHEEAADLYVKAQSIFLSFYTSDKLPDGETHVTIANSLLLEMKQFLANSRFSFSKALMSQ